MIYRHILQIPIDKKSLIERKHLVYRIAVYNWKFLF